VCAAIIYSGVREEGWRKRKSIPAGGLGMKNPISPLDMPKSDKLSHRLQRQQYAFRYVLKKRLIRARQTALH
jgi:hypothetical protein